MTYKKFFFKISKRVLPLVFVAYLYWPLALLLITTGLYDVVRQRCDNKAGLFKQYFLVNGALTWLFSPINTLMDILSLPFINKQVYKIDELPQQHQKEINQILNNCPKQDLIHAVETLQAQSDRTMLLYKWYGFNIKQSQPCELFHQSYQRILTIGVSTFKAQTQTSRHFGWLRANFRVLINIDDTENLGEGAYINVNQQTHVWKEDGPLFIFDDTVLHQSFNSTNQARHCLFIDIVRPSLLTPLITNFVKCLGYLSINIPFIRKTSNWDVV
jgi:hypothetical protein